MLLAMVFIYHSTLRLQGCHLVNDVTSGLETPTDIMRQANSVFFSGLDSALKDETIFPIDI